MKRETPAVSGRGDGTTMALRPATPEELRAALDQARRELAELRAGERGEGFEERERWLVEAVGALEGRVGAKGEGDGRGEPG